MWEITELEYRERGHGSDVSRFQVKASFVLGPNQILRGNGCDAGIREWLGAAIPNDPELLVLRSADSAGR
jgi:hypothetical protein